MIARATQSNAETCRVRALAAALAVISVGTFPGPADVAADDVPRAWIACDADDDCRWMLGDGGWPVAVNRRYVGEFREHVARRTPHTTFFMLADCLTDERARNAFLAQSRLAVACAESACAVRTKATCE